MASFAEGLAQGLQNLPLLMQRKKELDERQKQIDTEKDLKSADMLFKLMSNKDLPKSMKLNAYNQLSALNKKNGLGVNFPELTEWPDQADGFAKRGAKIFGSTDLSFQQKIEGLNGLLAEASDEGSNQSAEHIKNMMGELKATQARSLARAGEEIPFGLLDSIPKEERNDYLGLNKKETWGGLMPGPEGSQIQISSTGKVNTVLGRPPKDTQNEDTITSNVGINPQTNKPEYLTKSGKFTGIAPQGKDGKQPSWQRKTKTFYKGGKMFAQDYDFNPVTREEKNVGTPYERRDLDEEAKRQVGTYGDKLGEKRKADEEALDPAAIELAANNYVATGKMPSLGMGNAVMRSRILSKAAEIAKSRNIDFISLPAVQAEFQANAQNLTSLNKAYNQVMAFEKTAKANIEYAQELSTKYDRSRFPDFNSFMQAVASKTGGADIEAFRQAVYAASMEYMKVITAGSGVSSAELSVKAQEKAEDILNAAKTKNQFDAIIATMKVDMENRDIGYKAQISEIKSNLDRFSKKGGEAPQAKIKTADDYLRAKGLK